MFYDTEAIDREDMSAGTVGSDRKVGDTNLDSVLVVVLQLVELLQRKALGPPALVQVHQHALLGFRLLVINRDACKGQKARRQLMRWVSEVWRRGTNCSSAC